MRASLVRTFLKKTSLYLLDEPLTGLDENGEKMVSQLILEFLSHGASFIVASHKIDRLPMEKARVFEVKDGGLVLC